MKKHLGSSTVSLVSAIAITAFLGTSANAADLPRPVHNPIVAPIYNWTGCYGGANLGTAWGGGDMNAATGESISGTATGFAGGLQLGCDYQIGSFVIGARNLIDATSLSGGGTFGAGLLAGYSGNVHTTWFDALTVRAGYLMQPNWLLYAQGGFAWSSSSQTINNPAGVQVAQFSKNTGWTAGGGIEYMFTPRWTAFLEYNFMDFGTNTANFTVGITPTSVSVHRTVQTVLVGFNYRF